MCIPLLDTPADRSTIFVNQHLINIKVLVAPFFHQLNQMCCGWPRDHTPHLPCTDKGRHDNRISPGLCQLFLSAPRSAHAIICIFWFHSPAVRVMNAHSDSWEKYLSSACMRQSSFGQRFLFRGITRNAAEARLTGFVNRIRIWSMTTISTPCTFNSTGSFFPILPNPQSYSMAARS